MDTNVLQSSPVVEPQVTPQSPPRSSFRPWIFFGISLSVLAVMVCILGYIALTTLDVRIGIERTISPYIPSANFVVGENQAVSEEMYVQKAGLSRPGFIIFMTRPPLGRASDTIVSSQEIILMPAGSYEHIPISIDQKLVSSYGVTKGSRLFITLFFDDGDGIFNPQMDTLVRNIFGIPINTPFTIL